MKMGMRAGLCLAMFLSAQTVGQAAVQTKEITYNDQGVELKGFLAWDDAQSTRRPGVLLVHEWWGLNDYVRRRAEQLVSEGYVAFALDMYGAGKTTEHPQEAGGWAEEIRSNKQGWLSRAQAGLEVLRDQKQVDPEQIAAIGYCFGGSTVLQLAYANSPVRGVVSFHGALVLPEPGTAISPKILVCHGVDDAFIPPANVQAFQDAMTQSKADCQLIQYTGVRHGFTNPDADSHGIDNLKFDAHADRRSYRHMQQFFAELFGSTPGS